MSNSFTKVEVTMLIRNPFTLSSLLLALSISLSSPILQADVSTLNISAPFEITDTDPAKSGYAFSRMEVGESLVYADKEPFAQSF